MTHRLPFAVLLALMAAHALLALGVLADPHGFADWLYLAIEVGAVALTATRAVSLARNRAGWSLIAVALALWTAGDICWTFWLDALDAPPIPNVADALYLSTYVLLYAGLGLLLRERVHPFPAWLALDGLLAGLALGALVAGTVFEPVRTATEGSAAVVTTTLAYLVGDLLLLVVVIVAFTATGWRPGRSWWALGGGIAACALADGIYVFQDSAGTYLSGSWLDTLWSLALVAIALAAWQPGTPPSRASVGWSMAAIPLAGSAASIAVLVHAGFAHAGRLPVVLAAAALLAASARSLLMLRENFALLHAARREAMTDKLTDLPNRRALVDDLDAACASGSHSLLFFDLDGFKAYNDAFGHPAGDALLRRLAPALAAVGGCAYRLGGDEFCLLIDKPLADGDALVERAVGALSERGDGFAIGASYGLVVLPGDARDPTDALRLADERMYARKRRRRDGNRGLVRDLLVKVMAERELGLDEHNAGVAGMAAAVGRALGLDAEALDVLQRAAELHDIGKIAMPDGILHKPGTLDDAEWEIMRQHTIAGERILGVAESLRPVARIVRASHERWDGGGYPDGLAADAIPLGARIVCACDAYDAMRSRRAYKSPMAREAALAELRRCAGTQFDPRVIDVLTGIALGVVAVSSQP